MKKKFHLDPLVDARTGKAVPEGTYLDESKAGKTVFWVDRDSFVIRDKPTEGNPMKISAFLSIINDINNVTHPGDFGLGWKAALKLVRQTVERMAFTRGAAIREKVKADRKAAAKKRTKSGR